MGQVNSVNTYNNNIATPANKIISDILQQSNENNLSNAGLENVVTPQPDAIVPAYSVNNHSAEQPTVNYQNKTTAKQHPALSDIDVDKAKQGTNILDVLADIYKPDPLDEKALSRNRTLGSIGDGIKLLGQMYGAGRGAHIRNNNPNDSVTNYFLNEEKQLRDMYAKRMDDYKRLRFNAALQQYKIEQDIQENKRKEGVEAQAKQAEHTWQEKRDDTQNQYKIDSENRQEARDNNPDSFKNKIETQKFGETKRSNDARISQGWAHVGIAKQNAETNRQKAGKEGKKDYTSLAVQAMNDESFMNNLPDSYFNIKTDPNDPNKTIKTPRDNDTLGEAYSQYLEKINRNPKSPTQWGSMPSFQPNNYVELPQTNQTSGNNDPLGLGF